MAALTAHVRNGFILACLISNHFVTIYFRMPFFAWSKCTIFGLNFPCVAIMFSDIYWFKSTYFVVSDSIFFIVIGLILNAISELGYSLAKSPVMMSLRFLLAFWSCHVYAPNIFSFF